ncbi:hypothetical protein BpHYR1_024053 [Brachionus plicatilis]|uniref:Uncharacterized protein n=1 Tax=Brachionus plicatilis TaxID=10195 RepID=A0A3M7SJ91_BRAPC|nr:hypothetical protein BpHYR1_024053 [Brachionus plicatilis]
MAFMSFFNILSNDKRYNAEIKERNIMHLIDFFYVSNSNIKNHNKQKLNYIVKFMKFRNSKRPFIKI